MLSTVALAPAPLTIPAAYHSRVHQQRAPIIDALQTYGTTRTIPFSTPGHKRGAGLDRDLRELLGSQFGAADVWLNTADHDRSVRLAEDLAARTWGAERSFFLVNGSSSGNQAFLLANLAPGDEVVVGRDLHQSLLAALILTGARPVYVAPRLHPSLHVGLGVTARGRRRGIGRASSRQARALYEPDLLGGRLESARDRGRGACSGRCGLRGRGLGTPFWLPPWPSAVGDELWR